MARSLRSLTRLEDATRQAKTSGPPFRLPRDPARGPAGLGRPSGARRPVSQSVSQSDAIFLKAMTDRKQSGPKSRAGRLQPSAGRPFAPVPYDLSTEQAGAPADWSTWSVDDDALHAAESCEQGEIIRELVSTLQQLARMRSWARVYIGADNYFGWMPDHPQVRVSPDVYLLDDPPAPPMPRSWQTWRAGHRPPRWAVEVVSEDWPKDYEDGW